MPKMHRGNQPTDGGNLILDEKERQELIAKEPQAAKYIKRFMMGYEFINNVPRYCLWLVGVPPNELRKMPEVMKRVAAVREMRLKSTFAQTRQMADTPTLFREQINPDNSIVIPVVSSENRRYIPIGYIDKNIIAGNKLLMIENATIYHFGVLNSNVHMAWMRTTAGRLKSDYSYSINIVYNNFPWPSPTAEQKAAIEKTAQGILAARALSPKSSLADLYDDDFMPIELRRAHQANDRAVMQAYGLDTKTMNEEKCVAELMKLYQKLVD